MFLAILGLVIAPYLVGAWLAHVRFVLRLFGIDLFPVMP